MNHSLKPRGLRNIALFLLLCGCGVPEEPQPSTRDAAVADASPCPGPAADCWTPRPDAAMPDAGDPGSDAGSVDASLPRCAADCDDGVACTLDACTRDGTCTHLPLHRRCAQEEFCDATEDCLPTPSCTTDEECVTVSGGATDWYGCSTATGACRRESDSIDACDPLAQDCDSWEACYVGGGGTGTTCLSGFSSVEGERCASINQCLRGLDCDTAGRSDLGMLCYRFCDARTGAECSPGQRCEARGDLPLFPYVGYCTPALAP